jgi:nucleoside-diphosphate kinase
MAEEETLVIAKPDAVRRGLVGEIFGRIERKGLRIEEMRLTRIDRDLAERHYAEVVVARVAGERAVPVVRILMGPTDPADAPPGTIRGDFGTVITENLVHGSDSPESAKRELDLFFG